MQDDGGSANGGVARDTTARTLTIDVTPVNDAPAGADRSVTLVEDTAHVFATTDFTFSDSADSPANAWLAVRITTLPGAGMLTLNGSAITAGQSVSAADIAASRLAFTPAPDGNGSAYAGFTFQVQDDGGNAGGGADLDASPNGFSFDVTPVNDAPAGADGSVTFLAGAAYTFSTADFILADTRDTPSDALAALIIDSLPAAGSLALSSTAVTAGQVVSAADIAAARLVFMPAGSATTAFNYRVQDTGGTANGGADTAIAARQLQLVVAATAAPAAASNAAADAGVSIPGAPATAPPPTAPSASSTTPAPTAAAATTPASRSVAGDGGASAAGAYGPDAGLADGTLLQVATRAGSASEATGSLTADQRLVVTLSGERKAFSFESVTLIDSILTSAGRSESTPVGFDQFLTSLRSQGFIEELDRLREDARHEFDLEKSFAVSATGVTFGLSVAYVLWLVRSGVLVGSLLSSLPAWRVLDPLPVLARDGEVDEDDDDDDDDLGETPPEDADHPLQPSRGY